MAIVTSISNPSLTSQFYNPEDENLIPSFELSTVLNSGSYLEINVYDLNDSLVYSDLNYDNYSVKEDGQSSLTQKISKIILNPQTDLEDLGFDQGEYNVYYNILNPKVGSQDDLLYIKEISPDRKELKLTSNEGIIKYIEEANNFIQEREDSKHFIDFYINLGDNILLISNNIKVDPTSPDSILIKLYEPLLDSIEIKDELWVVTRVEDPLIYNVIFEEEEIIINNDSIKLKGPNFNVSIKEQTNNSTLELSYSDLVNTTLTSSKSQLDSLLINPEIEINIDYSQFSDFIHFSSVKTRLENFYYKVGLIEQYSSSKSEIITSITGSTSSSFSVNKSKEILQNKIDDLITNFDHYEYHLYYESGSDSYPKTNSSPQYEQQSTGSSEVLTWLGSDIESSPYYGGMLLSASLYDKSNKDNLLFTIPEYLRDDAENAQYELFINMVAHHYDNIWIYIKDVTSKFDNDNRLNYGISKDLIAVAIRDFGVKLYQNNFSNEDLYTAFLGLTPNGALFPFPNITGSYPTPSGYEYIEESISASSDIIPLDDVNKSLYKRLYHNLPHLLKTKGTIGGLRSLITTYGIPDTILRISEFGGKDKVNTNDWDYYYNKFNYKFDTNGNNFVSSSWDVNSTWNASNDKPSSIEFRFKTEGYPPTNLSQSLWSLYSTELEADLTLQYTGSGTTSGSYDGSIIDPEYQYATLTFFPSSSDSTISASVYLPFFDGEWWSVMVNSGSSGYELFVKNKIYNGNNGTSIGYQASSSITSSYDGWNAGITSYLGTSSLYNSFSGSYQELRYYKSQISESVFDDYVMNPLSMEGNILNSSPNELVFRASLGSELDIINSSSIHPKVEGSWVSTSSFTSNSDFWFGTTPSFTGNTEYYFLDQPAVGIRNRITDKVRLESDVIPSGDTLSPFRSLTQTVEASASYTPNINLLEVAFSPQNEINDDIISQLGYFNIGDYIGDPSLRTSSFKSYPDLDILRDEYFEKYISNYNLVDFIRLIKYFDNSLFKMIKDFVPARTSLLTGIVIKPHLLERNRVPQPVIVTENLLISGTVKPQWNNYEDGRISNPSGGSGGSLNIFNGVSTSPYGSDGNGPSNIYNITQSWDITHKILSGSVVTTHDTQDEFFNGEFSGSTLVVSTQDLNIDCNPYKRVNPTGADYNIRMYSGSEYTFNNFISDNNRPTDGCISIWYQSQTDTPIPPPNPTS